MPLHWLPSRDFLDWLAQRDFRVLTIARHPLDVLISAVRFAQFEPDTARWLMGTTGMPVQLGPDGTASPEFLDYCLSDGAASLLSVTPAWWPLSGTLQVRYETVVPNPRRQFGSLLQTLGVSTEGLDRALSSMSLASLQAFPNRHGWRGVPAHYSALVPTASAQRIYARHQGVFATLGYRRPLFWRSHRAAAKSWKMLS